MFQMSPAENSKKTSVVWVWTRKEINKVEKTILWEDGYLPGMKMEGE